ncbi:phage tail tube protein [Microbacterium oleivorans]|uniref:phage tail tube protein n=1 Tax=Microbacterium oleivorans TaxID=273677 RepID=UPI0033C8E31C
MATTSPFIGRREGIGIGIESVAGTAVAPQCWLRWLDNGFQNKTTTIENESAMGVVERVNDSDVVQKWAEGTIGGKVTSQGIGYLLLGMFGSVSTGAASGGIYPHTFSVSQSAVPTTLTVARTSPLTSQRHSYAVLDNLEITAETGGWVQVSSAIKARVGATSTETVAFTTEKEFTSKNVVLKLAENTAGLAAAPAVGTSRVQLTIERSSEAFYPLGTDDAPEFMRGAFEARGEFVVRLTDTQYESDFLSNAAKAMSIAITNDTESLTFTASQVRYRELEHTKDRDNVVTATVQFFCEFDQSANSSIVPVLRNTKTAYAAA